MSPFDQERIAMGAKRKSLTDTGPAAKAPKGDDGLKVPVGALLREEVRLFDGWLNLGSNLANLLPTLTMPWML